MYMKRETWGGNLSPNTANGKVRNEPPKECMKESEMRNRTYDYYIYHIVNKAGPSNGAKTSKLSGLSEWGQSTEIYYFPVAHNHVYLL